MKRLLLVFCTAVVAGCSSRPAPEAESAAARSIALTSKSPEAIAHFERGIALSDNVRAAEAAEEFAAALALDPGFLLARAEQGDVTPGPDGLKLIESAAAGAKDLSEPERLLIEARLASRRGESSAAANTLRRLTEIAPLYSRGHYLLGAVLLRGREDVQAGVAALKKATELDPNNGGAQNALGYAALQQDDPEAAIAAFNEYVRLSPQEPNAKDSLGEALLAAGRFHEAEAAFQSALVLSPQFFPAHEGIAYARFYAGDWKGGREALVKGKAAAARPADKFEMDVLLAAAAFAQENTAEALQYYDSAAKMEGANPARIAAIPYLRAALLVMSKRPREALPLTAEVIQTADSGRLPPAVSRNLRQQALRVRVAAEAQMKDVAAAKTTSASLDAEAASQPDNIAAQSGMHYGRGFAALASGDHAGARAQFDLCTKRDGWCRKARWRRSKQATRQGQRRRAMPFSSCTNAIQFISSSDRGSRRLRIDTASIRGCRPGESHRVDVP